MKFKKLIAISVTAALAAFAAAALSGCGDKPDPHEGQVKVVFSLEGAKFKNMTEPVAYYYPFEEGTENLIKDPETLTGESMVRENYNFKGWYRTKTVDGDKVTYSDKWDFDTDKVGADGVTLYACWRQYSYDVGYLDDGGEFVSFGAPTYVYDSDESSYKFDEDSFYRNYSIWYDDDGNAYTATHVLRDGDGNVWDPDFTHPRGDEDMSVRVIADYIKGEYTLVGSADELKETGNTDNIYLTADIDFKGGDYKGFTAYSGKFVGNGHTISNFNIKYSSDNSDLVTDDDLDGRNLLCISLFGRSVGAEISDVKFENVALDVNTANSRIAGIYAAPLFVTAYGCSVDNVEFGGTFKVTGLPKDFDESDLHIVTDQAFCAGEDNDITDSKFAAEYIPFKRPV